jgi:hydroxymethylpyrimidine/phosphomethylpyrimidine kinase
LTIAGSDSGGGAGIQADLKTFAAHGVYGMSVLTAVTAQNTHAVTALEALSPKLVRAQIDAVFEDIGVDAVKIGMLANVEIIHAVAEGLRYYQPPIIVLDPVMVAKSGDSLLDEGAVAALAEELLPQATLITPNLPEAERLSQRPVSSEEERRTAAQFLGRHGTAVLVKGGHGEGDDVVDVLVDAAEAHRFVHPRIHTTSTHGTGCTLSSAIAARLAQGDALVAAVGGAIDYLHGAISAAYPVGRGHGPVNHLYRLKAE